MSLTQVTDGFFVPRPCGSTCKFLPNWAGEVDIEEMSTVELQGLLQLLHTHVCSGEQAQRENVTPKGKEWQGLILALSWCFQLSKGHQYIFEIPLPLSNILLLWKHTLFALSLYVDVILVSSISLELFLQDKVTDADSSLLWELCPGWWRHLWTSELFIGVSRLPGPHDGRKFSYVYFIIYLSQPQIFKREGWKVARKQV